MQCRTDRIIQEWVGQAAATAAAERRSHQRRPFFRPVTVRVGGDGGARLAAFSRDISPGGIGLLHAMPLETRNAIVTVPTILGRQVEMSTEILWCAPCGEGWYISGGRFTGLSAMQATTLVLATIEAEAKRRLKQRTPFFRPVTVKTLGALGTDIPAFCRDISPTGVGLLHNMPLESQHVFLSIDPAIDISTDIRWSAPCGEGWYISGGQFRTLSLQELPAFRP